MREMLAYLGLAFFPVTIPLVLFALGARERAQKAESTLRDIALEAARRRGNPPTSIARSTPSRSRWNASRRVSGSRRSCSRSAARAGATAA